MLKGIWKRAALMAGVTVIVLSLGLGASAQQGGSGLIISPTRSELEIAPGGSDKISVSLKNVSGGDIIARAQINDFTSDGQTGEPRVIPDSKTESPNSIRKFLSGTIDLPLKSDEKKDFEIAINVPEGTPAGAYYGILRYTAVPGGESVPGEGKVALTASVGTLILIQVPGNITEQIQVRSIRALQNDKPKGFFLTAPTKIATEIKNTGNSFSKPFGRISIANGSKEVYSYELNNVEPKANILPGSVRTFTDEVKNVKKPGRYTVTANISHGRGGEVITYKSSFWYIPAFVIILFVGLILAIAAGGYLLYRKKFGRKRKTTGRR